MSAALAAANDRFRAHPETGLLTVTRGILARGPEFQLAALAAVQAYDSFGPTNDPYGHHDFGVVTVAGQRLSWKIDLYPDPLRELGVAAADGPDSWRMLTIMLPGEY